MENYTNQPNSLTTVQSFIFSYLRRNKIVAIGLLLMLFPLTLSIFSLFSPPPENQSPQATVTPSITNKVGFPTNTSNQRLTPSPTIINQQPAEDFEVDWKPTVFVESDLQGFDYEKTSLPNGLIQFSFPSENPSRPNITIVKNNYAILHRMLLFGVKVSDIVGNLGQPDYIATGSKFWGPEAVTYIYLKRGLAFPTDVKNNLVYEQLEFEPVPPSDFKKTYGEDLLGELVKP